MRRYTRVAVHVSAYGSENDGEKLVTRAILAEEGGDGGGGVALW